jgi:hypothetical protein
MELNINLNAKTPDYAMFTDLGNAAVHAIVVAAKANQMTWAQTYRALCELSRQDQFGEATDTAVRECVYEALAPEDEDFYV